MNKLNGVLLLLFGLVSSAGVWAVEDEKAKPFVTGDGLVAADLWQVLASLLFVIALIFLLAWLLRRIGGPGFSANQQMKVLSVLSVGSRERVMLIDVAGKQLLLGIAPGRVSRLHEFEQPVVTAGQVKPSEFANKMKQLLQADK